MKNFLVILDEAFNKRFGKLELTNIEDKLLFETYILFLASYKFEKLEYISFWKETFILLDLEEKNKVVNMFNENDNDYIYANIYCLKRFYTSI